MRIAYVVVWPLTGRSNIENKVSAQAKAWKGAGHKVRVFFVTSTVPPVAYPADVTVIPRGVSGNPVRRDRGNGDAYGKLSEEVDTFDPDVVYFRNCYYHRRLQAIAERYPSVIELNGLLRQELKFTKRDLFALFLRCYYAVTNRVWYRAFRGAGVRPRK